MPDRGNEAAAFRPGLAFDLLARISMARRFFLAHKAGTSGDKGQHPPSEDAALSYTATRACTPDHHVARRLLHVYVDCTDHAS